MTRTVLQGQTRYEVAVASGALQRLGQILTPHFSCQKLLLVCDRRVGGLYGKTVKGALEKAGYRVTVFVLPQGERAKTRRWLFRTLDVLAKEGFTRTDGLVALGGGATGDVAGLAAALYLRGIGYAQAPTTLLAQVDSSLGGKTAIDLQQGKNLAGAFYPPRVVAADPEALRTLDDMQWRCGMAEAAKAALIRDAELCRLLRRFGTQESFLRQADELLPRLMDVKLNIVQRDPTETGERMLLNFGHTLGHAYEAASRERIAHGLAVAMGMASMTALTERIGLSAKGTDAEVRALLQALSLPTAPPKAVLARARQFVGMDKKRDQNQITLVYLRTVGEGALHRAEIGILKEDALWQA